MFLEDAIAGGDISAVSFKSSTSEIYTSTLSYVMLLVSYITLVLFFCPDGRRYYSWYDVLAFNLTLKDQAFMPKGLTVVLKGFK